MKNDKNKPTFSLLDVTSVWTKVSTYAIQEDAAQYLSVLDEALKDCEEGSVLYLTGKSPIWLYMIFTSYIVRKRSDLNLFYSKPTAGGNRPYKIHPLEPYKK